MSLLQGFGFKGSSSSVLLGMESSHCHWCSQSYPGDQLSCLLPFLRRWPGFILEVLKVREFKVQKCSSDLTSILPLSPSLLYSRNSCHPLTVTFLFPLVTDFFWSFLQNSPRFDSCHFFTFLFIWHLRELSPSPWCAALSLHMYIVFVSVEKQVEDMPEEQQNLLVFTNAAQQKD